jgi:CheY-like chemotaxis protein
VSALLDIPSEKAAMTPSQSGAVPSRRILLVDDNPQILNLNAGVLAGSGYTVDTAEDGAAAWQALNEHSYNLLITDNNMPKVTGLQLIEKVRSRGTKLPIILASGSLPAEELNQCSHLRVDATLPKPFSIFELLKTVKKVLNAAEGAE